MADTGATLIFSSALGGMEAALEGYRALYAAGAGVESTGPEVFASVRSRLHPGLAVFERELHGLASFRDAAVIRRSGFDHFTLQHVTSGELRLETGEERRVVGAGRSVLLDMTKPFRAEAVHCRLHTVSLPRDRLVRSGLDAARLHGVALGAEAAQLPAVMAALMAHAPGADPLGRLDGVLRGLRRSFTSAPSDRHDAAGRVERACAFIEANLNRRDLAPGMIAAGVHTSRATLYRTFEDLGGVSAWVLTRRLRRMRTAVQLSRRPISEIVADVGFASLSHATTAFQARYGVSPGALRGSGLDAGDARASGLELTRRMLADMPVALVETRTAARSAA